LGRPGVFPETSPSNDDVILARLEHARQLGYCARVMRRWFNGREYSWEHFVRHGVPVAWLYATHDAQAIRVAQQAEREQEKTIHGQ